MSSAYEYISDLQRQSLVNRGRGPAIHDESEEAYDALRSREIFTEEPKSPSPPDPDFQRLAAEYPCGPFENYSDYSIVLQLYKDLAKVKGKTVPKLPPFGTLPIGSTNAKVVKLRETGEVVLLFQSGMFYLLHLLAKALAYTLPIVQATDGSLEYGQTNTPLTRASFSYLRFQDLMDSTLFQGDPRRAVPYLIPPRWEGFANNLRHCAELFVLAHELSHIQADHLSQPTTAPGDVPEEVVYDWSKEFEADAMGAELVVRAQNELAPPYEIQAAYRLFFRVIDLIARAKTLLREGPDAEPQYPKSHPSPVARMERLDNEITRIFTAQGLTTEFVNQAEFLGFTTQKAMGILWELYRPHLLEMRSSGATLSPVWEEGKAQAHPMRDWIGLCPFESCRRQIDGLRSPELYVRGFHSKQILGSYREIAISLMSSVWSSDPEVSTFCRDTLTWLYPGFPQEEEYLRDFAHLDLELRLEVEKYNSIHGEIAETLATHAVDAAAEVMDSLSPGTKPVLDEWFIIPFFDQFGVTANNVDDIAARAHAYLAYRRLDDPQARAKAAEILTALTPLRAVTFLGGALNSDSELPASMAKAFFNTLVPGELKKLYDAEQAAGGPTQVAFFQLMDQAVKALASKLGE